jgi:hypothetical protein
MFTNKLPSPDSNSFLPLIVLIIVSVGVLLLFTWGIKKSDMVKTVDNGQKTEDMEQMTDESTVDSPAQEQEKTGKKAASDSPERKDNVRRGARDVKQGDKSTPFLVYDFSLKDAEIPRKPEGVVPEGIKFDPKNNPDFKALLEIIEEQIEPLIGFRTGFLIESLVPGKVIPRKKSSLKQLEE